MPNVNKYQAFAKLEKTEGTPDYTGVKKELEAGDAVAVIETPQATDNVTQTTVGGATGTLSKGEALPGLVSSTITHKTLLRNSGNVANKPETDRYLLASGLVSQPVVALRMGAFLQGSFLHGEDLLFTYAPTGLVPPEAITAIALSGGKVRLTVAGTALPGPGQLLVAGFALVPGQPNINGLRTVTKIDPNTIQIEDRTPTDISGFATGANTKVHFPDLTVGGTKVGDDVATATELLNYENGISLPVKDSLVVGRNSDAYAQVGEISAGVPIAVNGTVYRPTSRIATEMKLKAAFTGGGAAVGDIIRTLGSNFGFGVVLEVKDAGKTITYEAAAGGFADQGFVEIVTEDNDGAIVQTGKTAQLDAAPALSGAPTITLENRIDGELVGVNGARLNFAINLQGGETVTVDWTGQGVPQRQRTKSLDVAVNVSTANGLQFRLAKVRFRDRTKDPVEDLEFCVDNLTFNSGNTLAERTCHVFEGIQSFTIDDREPSVSMTYEAALPIVKAWRELVKRQQSVELYVELGKGAGKRVLIHCPKLQPSQVADAARGSTKQVTLSANPRRKQFGDDEYAIYFV